MHLKRCLAAVLILIMLLGVVPAASAYSMPYYIHVDLTNQIVTIYNTSDNSIARQMLCSAGVEDKTPTGEWIMPRKERDSERTEWYWMPNAYTWVKYATKFYYAYFFHSIPYSKNQDGYINKEALEAYGNPASHGCIRLLEEDAKFIAKQCKTGTYVKIFRSGVEDPMLRAQLYEGAYIQSEWSSYAEFLGYSENDLGRSFTGSKVLDLQHRLTDLGYYRGSLDGVYGDDTIKAVSNLQKDLGLLPTGVCSQTLQDAIYSDHAPAKVGSVSLQEGKSGPIVQKLQTALQELDLYQGPIDGVYDADVSEAVRTFQNICGVPANGVASVELQHAIYYVLNKLHTTLGSTEYTSSYTTEEMVYGTIENEKANIIVRSKASTESSRVGTVEDGDRVMVLAVKGDWAQIVCDDGVGFIYKKYLRKPETELNYIMTYTAENGQSCTIGSTLQEKAKGASSLLKEFKAAYSAGQTAEYLHDSTVPYATVNTGNDDVRLNLRAAADSEAEILDKAANGASLRVLEQDAEWTTAVHNGQIVYLLSQYLDFWKGKYTDIKEVTESQLASNDAPSAKATVISTDSNKIGAKVYTTSAQDSAIFTRAPADLKVDVITYNAAIGWGLVEYQGQRGFMRAENLSFQ